MVYPVCQMVPSLSTAAIQWYLSYFTPRTSIPIPIPWYMNRESYSPINKHELSFVRCTVSAIAFSLRTENAKHDSTMVTVRQYDGDARQYDGDSPSYCRSVTIVLSYCHHRTVVLSPSYLRECITYVPFLTILYLQFRVLNFSHGHL